jgi:DNA-binding transcriptional MerR regulator
MVMQLTIQETAAKLGLSMQTVRRWVQSGKLQASQKPTSRGFIWMVDVPEDLLDEEPVEESPEVQTLREMNLLLREDVTQLREELTEKNSQIRELHVLLQGLQAALPSPVSRQHSWWRFWNRSSG